MEISFDFRLRDPRVLRLPFVRQVHRAENRLAAPWHSELQALPAIHERVAVLVGWRNGKRKHVPFTQRTRDKTERPRERHPRLRAAPSRQRSGCVNHCARLYRQLIARQLVLRKHALHAAIRRLEQLFGRYPIGDHRAFCGSGAQGANHQPFGVRDQPFRPDSAAGQIL